MARRNFQMMRQGQGQRETEAGEQATAGALVVDYSTMSWSDLRAAAMTAGVYQVGMTRDRVEEALRARRARA